MSKCDLHIVLDEPDGRTKAGENVSGTLVVNVNAECQCDALTIKRVWRTHGRGNRASGGELSETLFQGRFLPREEHEFKFSLPIPPAGPLTYRGELLNVDWYLEARADIPWALDPKAEAEFLVELGELWPSEDAEELMGAGAGKAGAFVGGVIGGIFALVGCGLLAGGVLGGEVALLFMGSMFAAVGLLVVGLSLRSVFAERKLGPVLLEIEPRHPRPGQEVRVALSFRPRSRCKINSITTTLSGKEVAVSGSGTNKTTHTHELASAVETLDPGRDVYGGDEVHVEGTVTIPADAPFSFTAPSNSITWDLNAHIDIGGWPDWSETPTLVVGPWR